VIKMRMIIAVHAATRPGLIFLPPVFAGASATPAEREGAVVVAITVSSQARSDSPALSSLSWMSATVARMMNKITERALA
jgi:hypothetical protein